MNRHSAVLKAAVLSGAMLASCVGNIGEPGGIAVTDAGAARDVDPARYCADPHVASSPMRRLTRLEYNNTVRDVLGDTSRPAEQFPPDDEAGAFNNNASAQTMSVLLAEGYMDAADTVAAATVSARLATIAPVVMGASEDTRARDFITNLGRRLYRRPLTSTEVTRLQALYTRARTAGTFASGVQTVLQAMLVSPNFLYRPELIPEGNMAAGSVVQASPYEIASRLSYLIWASAPDTTLLDAAERDELRTREQVATQARRMMQDERAHAAIGEFYAQWLGLHEISTVTKDAEVYPLFNADIAHAMEDETRAFVDHVVWGDSPRLDTLFTSPETFLNEPLARVYGVTGVTGMQMRRVSLNPTERVGILTQGSVLAAHAKPNQSSPVHRGRFVRERLLCQRLPDPPAGLQVVAPDPAPGLTTRQRFAEHSRNETCSGCHALMDGIGFGFENFDGVGRFRAQDQGMVVDASGELVETRDADGPFNGVVELAHRLARSEEVRGCVVTQWFRYTHGRTENPSEDLCSLRRLNEQFAASNYDLRELIVSLTQTDAFMYRRVESPAAGGAR